MEGVSNDHGPWLFAAMLPLLAHYCGGSWVAVLVLGAVCGGVCCLMPSGRPSRWARFLQILWAVPLLGSLGKEMAVYWPGAQAQWIVPTVILFLAAYGCVASPGRVGAVLCFSMALLWIPVWAAGIREAEPARLLSSKLWVSPWVVPALLLPLCSRQQTSGKWYAAAVLAGGALSAIAAAVLPLTEQPLRVLSRTLSLGALTRMESLVSVAVTLGWFCLSAWLIRSNASGRFAPWALALAAALWSAFAPAVPGVWAAVGSVALWGILPVLFPEKISKKEKKPIDK